MRDERYVRAVHEAAHTLMFTLHDAKVVDCVIYAADAKEIIDGQSCIVTGHTGVTELAKVAHHTVYSLVICNRAGFDAACRIDTEEAKKDKQMDEIKIQEYFDELQLPENVRSEILEASSKECSALLDEHWESIQKMAALLYDKGRLEGDEVRAIIQGQQ
jgi:hypothetical protein